jgi:hypothetical protein
MYWGRDRVCDRLDRLFREAAPVMPYAQYVDSVLERSAAA